MNNIAMYADDFASITKEIRSLGGEVTKIFHNQVFFTQNGTNFVFSPKMTDGGPVFIKEEVKA